MAPGALLCLQRGRVDRQWQRGAALSRPGSQGSAGLWVWEWTTFQPLVLVPLQGRVLLSGALGTYRDCLYFSKTVQDHLKNRRPRTPPGPAKQLKTMADTRTRMPIDQAVNTDLSRPLCTHEAAFLTPHQPHWSVWLWVAFSNLQWFSKISGYLPQNPRNWRGQP